VLAAAGFGDWISRTDAIQRLRGKFGFDPDDISRGLADQIRDYAFGSLALVVPQAAPWLAMASPGLAAQIAAATPSSASGVVAQLTAGPMRSRGTIVQSTARAMSTRGLSVMSGMSDGDGPDMG